MTNKELMEKLEAVLAINEKLMAENRSQKAMLDNLKAGDSRNIAIGCNAVYGVTLRAPNGEIEIDVNYGEITNITSDDVKTLLKRNSTRKLFISGIVYFVDETEYDNFGVKRRASLNDDYIISTFQKGNDAIREYFEDATSRKYDSNVMNILFYKIIVMNLDGKFGNLPYEIRTLIEDYFGMKIDMAERLYKRSKSIM